jgi:hypothetical protein
MWKAVTEFGSQGVTKRQGETELRSRGDECVRPYVSKFGCRRFGLRCGLLVFRFAGLRG